MMAIILGIIAIIPRTIAIIPPIIPTIHGPPNGQIRVSARIYGTLAFFSLISLAGFDQKAGLTIILFASLMAGFA